MTSGRSPDTTVRHTLARRARAASRSLLLGLALAALPWSALGAEDLPALDGLDPVRLLEGAREDGDPLLATRHEGLVYRFASDRTRREFLADPARFAVQMGGACARMGPGVEGEPDLFAVHDGKLYLFGTGQCMDAFLEHPERYLPPEAPPIEPGREQLAEARELLTRSASALVDRPLKRIGGYRLVGRVERGPRAEELELWVGFDGAVRRERRAGPARLVEAWDGERGWLRTVRGVETLSATRRHALLGEVDRLDALTVLRSLDAGKAVAVVEEPPTPGPTRLVRAVAPSREGAGEPVTIEIDRYSGRVVSLRFRGRGPGGFAGWITRRFDDFRPAGGAFLPFRRADFFEDAAEPFQVTVVESLEVVDGFDRDLFATPLEREP